MSVVRTSSYPVATLRAIAQAPQDVRALPPLSFHKLAAHRAIEVRDGIAAITPNGLRQLRNLK